MEHGGKLWGQKSVRGPLNEAERAQQLETSILDIVVIDVDSMRVLTSDTRYYGFNGYEPDHQLRTISSYIYLDVRGNLGRDTLRF